MKSKIIKKRIAIFIDGANFEISLKQSGLYVDYQELIKWAEKGSRQY